MRRLLRDSTASAAIEFAFCMPFMISLVIGVAEFGRAIWAHHLLVTATRDASRYLTRVPDPESSAYQARATNLARYGNTAGTGSPLMPAGYGTVTLSYAFSNVGGAWVGRTQTVTATARFTFTSDIIDWFGLSVTLPMAVSHAERLQTD